MVIGAVARDDRDDDDDLDDVTRNKEELRLVFGIEIGIFLRGIKRKLSLESVSFWEGHLGRVNLPLVET